MFIYKNVYYLVGARGQGSVGEKYLSLKGGNPGRLWVLIEVPWCKSHVSIN